MKPLIPKIEMTDTYRVYVGNTIFWWHVPKEIAEEYVKYYKHLHPDREVKMVKNEKT